MGVSSSESHDLTAFYELLTASFGVLSQNTGFYPSLDRIVETTLGPLNLGPGGGSYNEPISHLHRKIDYTTWYIGQVMKVPMRKLHGYQHKTSPIHLNSASYSTNNTPISQAPRIAEREVPITHRITVRPPASFFFLSYFLSFLLLCKIFPFLSFPFCFSFQNVSSLFLSISPSKMFPLLSFPFFPLTFFLSFPFLFLFLKCFLSFPFLCLLLTCLPFF